MPRPWADLPYDMLRLIAIDLSFADYIAFASVCSNWSAVLVQPQDVWLVGHLSHGIFTSIGFQFYHVVRDVLVLLPTEWFLGLICCGSSRGWLLLASINFLFPRLLLYHPVYQSFIDLPTSAAPTDPPWQFAPSNIRKFVLSADPAASPSDWIAFAVTKDPTLPSRPDYAFYRPGNRRWTPLAPAWNAEACGWPDVEFHRRKFYVTTRSQLLVCKLDRGPPRMKVLERAGPAVRSGGGRTFLVKRDAELLFISLSWSLIGFPAYAERRELEVYKVNFLRSSRVEFLKQEDVGEHALFLGENHSFALNSICYPRCRRNTIYLACDGNSRILLIDLDSKIAVENKIPAIRQPAPPGFSLRPRYWYMQG